MTTAPSSSPRALDGRDHHRRGVLLAAASAAGFGLMAIFANEAYDAGVDVPSLLTLRFAIAAVLFWAIVLVRRPAIPAGRDAVLAVALGAVGYAAQAACFFAALTYLDASLVALLLYVHPTLVFAGAVLLGRDAWDAVRLAALAAALTGAALVLLGGGDAGGDLAPAGVALGLGAALAYTGYILVADRAVARLDPFAVAAMLTTGATATFAIAGGGLPEVGAEAAAWTTAIALVGTVGAVSCFFLALRDVGPATASIVSTLEPVVTVALAVAVLGESLAPLQLAGGLLVVGSAIVVARVRPRGAPAPTGPAPAARQAEAGAPGR